MKSPSYWLETGGDLGPHLYIIVDQNPEENNQLLKRYIQLKRRARVPTTFVVSIGIQWLVAESSFSPFVSSHLRKKDEVLAHPLVSDEAGGSL